MFRAVPLPIIRSFFYSLYIWHWYMSYGWKTAFEQEHMLLLESCLQTVHLVGIIKKEICMRKFIKDSRSKIRPLGFIRSGLQNTTPAGCLMLANLFYTTFTVNFTIM